MHVLRTLGEGKVLWISICTCVACARRCQEIGFLYLLAHSLGIVILLASALFLCHSASPGTACNYVHVVCIHISSTTFFSYYRTLPRDIRRGFGSISHAVHS